MNLTEEKYNKIITELGEPIIQYLNHRFRDKADQYITQLMENSKPEIEKNNWLIDLYTKMKEGRPISMGDGTKFITLDDNIPDISDRKAFVKELNGIADKIRDPNYIHLGTKRAPSRVGELYLKNTENESAEE